MARKRNELARVPWHVAKSPSEFHALGGVLGIKCVGIFNEEVRVEQFVRVFVRIGCGRLGATEMNHLLVARHDGVDRRILPRPQTCEAKLACVIGERCGNVHGEEHWRNLTDHRPPSLPQMASAARRVAATKRICSAGHEAHYYGRLFGAAASTAGPALKATALGTKVTRKSPNSSSRIPE